MRAFAGAIAAFVMFGLCFAASAATDPPAGTLNQQQFDALAETVSQMVVKKLENEGVVTVRPSPAREPQATPAVDEDHLADEAAVLVERAGTILSAYPTLWSRLTRITAVLDESAEGGRGLFAYLLVLAAAVAAAWAPEVLLRQLLMPVRRRVCFGPAGPATLSRVAVLALLDGLGLASVLLVSYGIIGAWFSATTPQSRLAAEVLASFFSWRLYLFAFRVFFRPDLPLARIAQMPDAGAIAVYRRLAVTVLIVLAQRTLMRTLIALGAPWEAIGAARLFIDAFLLASFVWAAYRSRDAVAHWFGQLADSPDGRGARAAIARNWLRIAIPFFVILALANAYGAVSARLAGAAALLLTLNIIIGLLLFETFRKFVGQNLIAAREQIGAQSRVACYDLVARCLRAAVLAGAIVTVAQAWIVNVLGFLDLEEWQALTRSGFRAGMTIYVAYVAWQIVSFVAARYTTASPPVPGQAAQHDPTEILPAATRLATVVPLLKTFLVSAISIVALLIALYDLGVNTTPLIAGASILGLAISFGSQTLVHDIVSGVFYLADDAFRVGEYIDCGKAKGTVDGFTMRSLRLRHQNGPIHTIPFGQLGQITNYSRDWSTVKFILRFARDTDLEKLRKLVKKIGLEMMEDPDLKAELLQPLKMMGMVDIADNALLIRFKFTVRPSNPGLVQREALKRMFRAFPEAGIEFSNATVAVQTLGGTVETGAAGAAASAALAKVQMPPPGE